MKAFSDLEQSKKLAEILPLESADMGWNVFVDNSQRLLPKDDWDLSTEGNRKIIPAWSLTALLGVLPKQFGRYTKSLYWFDDAWHCEYIDEDSEGKYGTLADNPLDVCYKMILKLNEKNLL